MATRLYSLLKSVIGLPLTLLALFFIGKILFTQASTFSHMIHSFHFFLLGYGIISFILFYFLRSYIWYRIVRLNNATLSFKESSYLWAMSELKRYIPGNIWSFLGRAVLFEEKGMQKKAVAKGMILEAELFVMGSCIIALLSMPFYFRGFHYQTLIEWAIAILVACGLIFYCFHNKFAIHLTGKRGKLFSFIFPLFSPGDTAFLLFISSIALFFFGLGNYFVITSVIYLSPYLFLQFIGIFVLAFVAGYLSVVTPAGFGVREGIVIFSLGKIMSTGLATFAAVFSRIILICSELLFILLTTLWHKVHNPFITRIEKTIAKHPQVTILSFFTGVYFIYFTTISFLRYDNFYAGRFDLGNMAQTVWNTLHGKIFLFTDPNGTEQISRLAFHADFILVLLAPFYALWESPKMLLLIQTIVVVAGAFFIYIIARDVLKHRNLALVFAFSFLLNPSLERANIFDFHAVTLVTTFFLATYYFFLKKRYVWFIVFAILAALCKEQVWLVIALLGLLVFFKQKKHLLGAILFFFSIGMFYMLIWYAIPKTLGAQHFALAYFSDFGDNPTQVVKGIVFSPQKIIQTVFEHSRLIYLNQLFSPVGYLALFFPFFLIFAGPDLLINLLSNNAQLHEIYYQYTATITPFIFLASIYAVSWIRKSSYASLKLSKERWNVLCIIYILAAALIGGYAFGPLPGEIYPNLDMITKQVADRTFIDNYLNSIPKDYPVTASNALGSHLSLREDIYTIPYGIDQAKIIVLLFTDIQSRDAYNQIIKDPHYHEVIHKDNFVAFEKK